MTNIKSTLAALAIAGSAAIATPNAIEAQQNQTTQCEPNKRTSFVPQVVRENAAGVQDNQTPVEYVKRGDRFVAVVPYNPSLDKHLRVTGEPDNLHPTGHPFFDGPARGEGRVSYQGELKGQRHTINHLLWANCEARPATTIFVPITPRTPRSEPAPYNAAQQDSVIRADLDGQYRAIINIDGRVVNLDERVINLEGFRDSVRAAQRSERPREIQRERQAQTPTAPAAPTNEQREARSQMTVGAGYFTQISESEVPRGTFTMNISGPSAYALIVNQPGENGLLLAARGFAVNASGDHGEQGGLRERTAITTNYIEAEGVLAKKFNNYLIGGRGTFEGATTTELASSTNTTVQGRARATNGRATAQGLVGYDNNGVRVLGAMGPRIRDDAQSGTNPQMVYTLEAAREGLGPVDARVRFEHVQNGDATVTGTTGTVNYRFNNGLGIGAQVTRSSQRTLAETTGNTLFGLYGTYTFGGKR